MKNFNLNINGVIVVNYDDMIYRCSIQDVSEEHFSITVPVNNGEFLMLNRGEKLDIEYCNEAGNYYEFSAKVMGRDISNKISMYKLSLPTNVVKIQRRNYVRVPFTKEVQYKKIEDDSWKKGMLLDLSGGGIRLKSKEELNFDEKLLIKIETKSGEFEVLAQVKRCEKLNFYECVYGLEFVDINENKRDKIVEEVFLVMRKQRETI